MTETHDPLGSWAGRFWTERLLREPRWIVEAGEYGETLSRRPSYYGQTLALAMHLKGKIADLAGGYVGVGFEDLGPDVPVGAVCRYVAYDSDSMGEPGSQLCWWYEDAEGHMDGTESFEAAYYFEEEA